MNDIELIGSKKLGHQDSAADNKHVGQILTLTVKKQRLFAKYVAMNLVSTSTFT
jgi:hypothetical protein